MGGQNKKCLWVDRKYQSLRNFFPRLLIIYRSTDLAFTLHYFSKKKTQLCPSNYTSPLSISPERDLKHRFFSAVKYLGKFLLVFPENSFVTRLTESKNAYFLSWVQIVESVAILGSFHVKLTLGYPCETHLRWVLQLWSAINYARTHLADGSLLASGSPKNFFVCLLFGY